MHEEINSFDKRPEEVTKQVKKCDDRSLKVHSVNVIPQHSKKSRMWRYLCCIGFTTEDEKAVFEKLIDGRRDLVS